MGGWRERRNDCCLVAGIDDMTYRECIKREMERLAKDDRTIFIGYNVSCGHRFNGTLNDIPYGNCIEMPVAENLILGLAMGLSLEGYRPVVCIERMDFLWACADAIVNHLDKLPRVSGGQIKFNILIRTCVGDDKPLDPGEQHTGSYYRQWKDIVGFPVVELLSKDDIQTYLRAIGTIMTIEYKALYDNPLPRR